KYMVSAFNMAIIVLGLSTLASLGAAAGEQQARPASNTFPSRSEFSLTGTEFLAATRSLSAEEREDAILFEIANGNVPDLMRQQVAVSISIFGSDGKLHRAKLFVVPDYLAIGSDEDF